MEPSRWLRGLVVACASAFAACTTTQNQQNANKSSAEPNLPSSHSSYLLRVPPQYSADSFAPGFTPSCDPKLPEAMAHKSLSYYLHQEERQFSALPAEEVQKQTQQEFADLKEFYQKLFSCEGNNSQLNVLAQEIRKSPATAGEKFERLYNLLNFRFEDVAAFYNDDYFKKRVAKQALLSIKEMNTTISELGITLDFGEMEKDYTRIMSQSQRRIVAMTLREDMARVLGVAPHGENSAINTITKSIVSKALMDAIKNGLKGKNEEEPGFQKLDYQS